MDPHDDDEVVEVVEVDDDEVVEVEPEMEDGHHLSHTDAQATGLTMLEAAGGHAVPLHCSTPQVTTRPEKQINLLKNCKPILHLIKNTYVHLNIFFNISAQAQEAANKKI